MGVKWRNRGRVALKIILTCKLFNLSTSVAFPRFRQDFVSRHVVWRPQDKSWRIRTEFCPPCALHVKIEGGVNGGGTGKWEDKLCLWMERWNKAKWINGCDAESMRLRRKTRR